MKLWTGLACAAALAAGAQAAALPPLTQDGLDPVRIGMTVPQVEHALGAKLKVDYPEDHSCGEGGRADGIDPDVFYMFVDGRVARIEIGTPRHGRAVHATAAGIHVGATEADIRRAYGAHVVVTPHPYLEKDSHYVKVELPHHRSLLFETDHGRVTTFRGGDSKALDYIEGCL